MSPRIKRYSCPFPSKATGEWSADQAYALLILMMGVTVLLVSLTTALPSIYLEGQREREEELIFRGNEYARAIAFFHRRFNRYPASVDELLRTNGIRFLRRAYPDPMSRDGKWRFIHASATGAILDSLTRGGMPTQAGFQTEAPSTTPGGTPTDAGFQPQAPSTTPKGPRRRASRMFGETDESRGTYIMGVASSNHHESIRVYNNRRHYDEWEFLGTEVTSAVPRSMVPGQPRTPGGLPTTFPSPTRPGRPGRPPVSPNPMPMTPP